MSQHDFVIDNQSFPATRTDLNAAILAVASNSSGATAPTTTYANQFWYDTSTDILKVRNEANSAWINLFTIGSQNVLLGDAALDSNVSGVSNTAIGTSALTSNTTASNNTAVGYQSAYTNTSGDGFTAIGTQSLYSNTTGDYGVAVGWTAAYSNTTGQPVAVGTAALYTQTTGENNTAIGHNTLQETTTGEYNTAVGRKALQSNTTASNNTAVGYQALYANTTGAENVAFGAYALDSVTTGLGNAAIGYGSGNTITTGSRNTILGAYDGNQGGLDIRTASNNIVLSDGAGNPRGRFTSDGAFHVGDYSSYITSGDVSRWYMGNGASGYFHRFLFNGSTVGSIQLSGGSGTSFVTSSDYRLKENVVYDWDATTRLKQLKPARFNFIADADTTVDGFLAHEAQAVVPESVVGTHNEVDDDGAAVMQGIDQSKLVPLLVKTIQELEERITALEGN